ncbi:MAG TPA: TPM domain-containing protein [Rhodanobacter sp.]|nr:TPM domain-containing protein [Rhodanobacter sp.]
MARMQRLMANLFEGWFQLRRRFPATLLDEITVAIAAGERTHKGELCVAIESRLDPFAVLSGLDAPARARQAFSQLRAWDTEHNSGVLIYVLLAEHRIEIVADRGIAARVAPAEWAAICARMRENYARGQWREGSLAGIAAAHALLLKHFPGNDKADPDELPDRPVFL